MGSKTIMKIIHSLVLVAEVNVSNIFIYTQFIKHVVSTEFVPKNRYGENKVGYTTEFSIETVEN